MIPTYGGNPSYLDTPFLLSIFGTLEPCSKVISFRHKPLALLEVAFHLAVDKGKVVEPELVVQLALESHELVLCVVLAVPFLASSLGELLADVGDGNILANGIDVLASPLLGVTERYASPKTNLLGVEAWKNGVVRHRERKDGLALLLVNLGAKEVREVVRGVKVGGWDSGRLDVVNNLSLGVKVV